MRLSLLLRFFLNNYIKYDIYYVFNLLNLNKANLHLNKTKKSEFASIKSSKLFKKTLIFNFNL